MVVVIEWSVDIPYGVCPIITNGGTGEVIGCDCAMNTP